MLAFPVWVAAAVGERRSGPAVLGLSESFLFGSASISGSLSHQPKEMSCCELGLGSSHIRHQADERKRALKRAQTSEVEAVLAWDWDCPAPGGKSAGGPHRRLA